MMRFPAQSPRGCPRPPPLILGFTKTCKLALTRLARAGIVAGPVISLNRIGASSGSHSTRWTAAPMLLGALLCMLVGCGGGEEPGSRPAGSVAGSSASSTSSASSSAQTSAPTPTTDPTAPAAASGTSATAKTTGASPQGAAQIRARAAAICTRRNHELKSAPLAGGGLSATASNASRRAAIERQALTELGALSPPPGAVAQWKAMIDQTKVVLAEVVKLAAQVRAGDREGVTRQIGKSNLQFRLLVAAAHANVGRCAVVG
jgi:hypothetical protein